MATKTSCLTGVDEDDKDSDSELHAYNTMQESVRMAQESDSSFGKPCLKQTSVLDVLSNTDLLSPVGLENGPALHQAVQDHELNSITSEKEEEKSITPLKTVQEIDNSGIWGFDVQSPENSLDNFSSASDLSWDPHKEFMHFLWDNHNDSPSEEIKEEVKPVNIQRRRKRKMDMVVMVDPSEDLYPNLSPESSEESCDEENQVDSSPIKITKPEKNSKPQSSPTEKVSKYPNGTVKAIKEILYKTPESSHEKIVNHKISPVKMGLMMNSHSESSSLRYPCSKCKLSFTKEHLLLCHLKSHDDPSPISQKSFTCRECGQSFKQSSALTDHMSIHQEEKPKPIEAVKDTKDKKKEKTITMYFCPQCSFGTTCPNTFVKHAKTHEKDKKFRCDKCCYTTQTERELRKHHLLDHTIITVKKTQPKEEIEIFPCDICSYKAFGKKVFKNHLILRHQLTLDEYTTAQKSGNSAQPARENESPTCKTPAEDTELTSKISLQNQKCQKVSSPDESSSLSDLFKNSKVKGDLKSKATESKLDKSINVLLSRQNNGSKGGEQNEESNNYSAQDSKSDKIVCDQTPQTMSVKVEFSAGSPNGPKMSMDQSPVKKSPSKRKMSTPYRNTSDQDSCFILPKPLSSPKKLNLEDVADLDEKDIFPGRDSEANSSYFDSCINKEKKHIIYTYSRRMSMRGALQASKKLFEKIKTEDHEQNDPEIKEESIETEVFQETFESHQIPFGDSSTDDVLELESDQKNCPYCPAIFESGVGLSNHVRGHLHRVGLSYEERHAVPPEQVADQDRRPRIRRRFLAIRRLRKGM